MIMLLSLSVLTSCGSKEQAASQETIELQTVEQSIEEPLTESSTVPLTEEATEEAVTDSNPISIVFESEGSEDFTGEDGTVLLQFTECFPTITIADKDAASEKINGIYRMEKSNMDYSKQAYYSMAVGAYEALGEDKSSFQTYQYDYTVSAARCDSSVISFVEVGTQFTGGDLPHKVSGAMNFNPETGERLKLPNITENPDALKSFCREKIKEQCKAPEYEGKLFEHYETGIESAFQEGVWYFSEEGLCVICNEYVIADQDQGLFTFTIPYDEIKDMIKADYIP